MHEALLIVRLALGLGIAAHGAQKLFGWFKGYGLANTGEYLVSLGFPPGRTFATLAGIGEFAGGLMIALGLGGPLGCGLVILVMLTAVETVHLKNGFFATNNGWELPLVYALCCMVLAFTGPGRYSLDFPLGLEWLTSPRNAWLAIVAGVAVALVNFAIARMKKAPQAAPAK